MSTELKPHILIVDDNLEMARTLADGLEERGYDAVAQGSGRKALEWLAQHPCDALVTDLRMSEVDGLQLRMRELQHHYAGWAVAQLGGNKRRTAEKLDVDQKTLGRLRAEEEESSAAA